MSVNINAVEFGDVSGTLGIKHVRRRLKTSAASFNCRFLFSFRVKVCRVLGCLTVFSPVFFESHGHTALLIVSPTCSPVWFSRISDGIFQNKSVETMVVNGLPVYIFFCV